MEGEGYDDKECSRAKSDKRFAGGGNVRDLREPGNLSRKNKTLSRISLPGENVSRYLPRRIYANNNPICMCVWVEVN